MPYYTNIRDNISFAGQINSPYNKNQLSLQPKILQNE
jgi:hypothetical protein